MTFNLEEIEVPDILEERYHERGVLTQKWKANK